MINHIKYKIPYELDSPERTIFHNQIIRNKLFIRKLYEEWYEIFSATLPQLPDGKMVELGSGGGFLKEVIPSVLCSDILDLPFNDLTFSALDMPFENNELSAVFMIDTFHHIPDANRFLSEVDRVLKKDGMVVMIEPANSLWGRIIYKNFHHEPFEPEAGWTIPRSGPLSGANGALPWIVFERNKKLFESNFPNLEILEIRYHTPFRYLVSGGVSFKQLVPDFSYRFFSFFDQFLSSISRQISMFL
ncbi:MAG: class I SAM-dependent methyltransferase, partial [Bacteroidales bacterium]|nr:class I SAM-dependent methyltransferase [Bacteroidales bacterium]